MNPETEKLIRDICAFIHTSAFRDGATGPLTGNDTVMVVDIDALVDAIAESTGMSKETLGDWVDEEWEKLDL